MHNQTSMNTDEISMSQYILHITIAEMHHNNVSE